MRYSVVGAVALLLICFAGEVAAEPPVVVLAKEDAKAPAVVQPVKPVRPTASKMIKGAEKLVLKTIRMTVWEGKKGDCAILKFDPMLEVGGKLRITYEF